MKPQIVFIGTSASTPTHTRFSPAILLCSFKTCILLDVGEATQINLGRMGIDPLKISIIGITHMHGDHYYGLLPIIDTIIMRLSSQNKQGQHIVRLLGPEELCSMYFKQPPIYGEAVNSHSNSDKNLVEIECIDAETLSSGKNYIQTDGGDIAITSVNMNHGNIRAYGYVIKVRTGEGTNNFVTVFYSGDGICSDQCPNTLKRLGPCIVIHEATFIDYENDRAKARKSFHATISDAAYIAEYIEARMLIVTHISLRYRADWIRDYVSRAQRIFNGDIFIADDLSVLPLDKVSC
ncbi:MAG: MBL fold metallo-hydrolase [Ignisphaera sp.]